MSSDCVKIIKSNWFNYFRYFNHFVVLFFFAKNETVTIDYVLSLFFKDQRALFSVDFMHNFSLKYH